MLMIMLHQNLSNGLTVVDKLFMILIGLELYKKKLLMLTLTISQLQIQILVPTKLFMLQIQNGIQHIMSLHQLLSTLLFQLILIFKYILLIVVLDNYNNKTTTFIVMLFKLDQLYIQLVLLLKVLVQLFLYLLLKCIFIILVLQLLSDLTTHQILFLLLLIQVFVI